MLLFKGLMRPIMEESEFQLEAFFHIKPPGNVQISIFHRILHFVP